MPNPANRPASTWCQSIAPGSRSPPGSRGQHEILAFRRRIGSRDLADQIPAVGAVAVQERDDAAGRLRRRGACRAGAPVALPGIDHPRAGGARHVLRAVGAAAVGDDDLGRHSRAGFRG